MSNQSINDLAKAIKAEMKLKLRAYDTRVGGDGIAETALHLRKFYLNK